MFKVKCSKLSEYLCKRTRIVILIVPCLVMLTIYILSEKEFESENFLSLRSYNSEDDLTGEGYLVWNPKCHLQAKNPLDWSIKKYVVKEKFEACSSDLFTSRVERDPINGSVTLFVNNEETKAQNKIQCCWTPISRVAPSDPPKKDSDSKISVGKCEDFAKRVTLPPDLEIAKITCRHKKKTMYENVHAIINPAKVQDRFDEIALNESSLEINETTKQRKLSVLILGIDSVSRLNFIRSLPKTEGLLRENEWCHLRGYNKMGDNTFPNLMAILTGQNQSESYAKCKPKVPYGLDNCPMLWYDYRKGGYVTAYGEDLETLSTFNYLKAGFVEPPTDYYLRPYVIATEKLLKAKKRFGNNKYCTGPEVTIERIFNYALDFARTFLGKPYFGFFWTNSVSHDDTNGVSSMDHRFYKMFKDMEKEGILNDTMIVFLSDHGMRWGGLRQTLVGWYEERLPFIYIRLPDWFRDLEPNAHRALRVNEHRLTSPYDLYETLRDVLARSGVQTNSSSGCPTCQSLFKPVPMERGCPEAGISTHWCTCTAFERCSVNDEVALRGSKKFFEHVENIVKHYKDKKGKRLCSRLKLKKILRIDKIVDLKRDNDRDNVTVVGYFYLIDVTPGDGRYEITIRYHGGDNFTVDNSEVSRINSYASSSGCLDEGEKRYCHCVGK